MFRTLYRKLLLVFLGFGAMMTIICLLVLRVSHETFHLELDQRTNRELAKRLVNERFLAAAEEPRHDALQRVLDHLTAINPDIAIYLLDTDGQVLVSSGPPGSVKRYRVDIKPIRAFLDGHTRFPILGDDPADAHRREVFSAAPISTRGHPDGLLYIVLHRPGHASGAKELERSYALAEGSWFILGGATFAILASIWIIRVLTHRLGRLSAAMEQFRSSGFAEKPRLSVTSASEPDDEITWLGNLFNQMAERIVAQMQKLKETDETRRELVANISHDLRTPLTSLRAHLETLALKDDTLTAEEKKEYLDIATKQSQRMARLVDKLFELAKLDAHQVQPSPEPFILADLAQDVAQKFELIATNKRVRIRTEVPDRPALVLADIGLIERVLDNLLENAVRYTPAGGSVAINLIQSPGHMTVQVSDTGTGISNEDLPHIFDRFYRGEKNRPATFSSAGLGLAIVKGILELHNSAIRVESNPGRGAIFAFDLPLVTSGQPAAASSVGSVSVCGSDAQQPSAEI